jgi:bacteriocin biosynthesis cyclodehydratase domain-containing protein
VERPRLKANYRVVPVDQDKTFLVAADRHYLIGGTAAALVVGYLDGGHTVADIAGRLVGQADVRDVLLTLRKLDALGVLAEGESDLPTAVLAHWDGLGVDPADAVERIEQAEVAVLTLGGCADAAIIEALHGVGLRTRSLTAAEAADRYAPGAADLLLVVTDDYLRPELRDVNAAALESGRPWVAVKLGGNELWYGPLFTPGHSGCWECMRHRLAGNRHVERYLARKRGEAEPLVVPVPTAPTAPAAAGALIAGEVARIVATGTSPVLDGRMRALELQALEVSEHVLVRRPQCRACGDPALVTDRSSEPKPEGTAGPLRHTDGGLRTQRFQATLDRLERHISPYFGAISSLRAHEASEANGVTYSFTAGHNFAMYGDNLGLLRRNMRGQSGGKGRTELQAKVSAVCEGIERYSAVWEGDEPTRVAAYDDLDPARAVHPEHVLMFSDAQYADRDALNELPVNRLQPVPLKFRADEPISWTPGWSLTERREVLVPSAIVWYGHPDLSRYQYCFADSNGSAAGNTMQEAILQGFCELVERDSVALWWYNKLRRPGFDLDSLKEPYVEELRAFYAGMGRSLWLLDVTSDLGIPTFAGISHRIGHPVEDIMIGFGAHPSARIAALRALTEVNQLLPAVERRDQAGNTLYLDDDPAFMAWFKGVKLADEPWLRPDDGQPVLTLSDYGAPDLSDLGGCIEGCVEAARACGLELIVVDQSRPDLDLRVVKVVAPGMRHFWKRTGPGRLYDVPVRMGWLAEPTPEERLNPTSVFF